MAKIILSRKKEWANRARKFNIFIDGEKKDTISNGEIKELELEPGKHEIVLKVDWCSSPVLETELKEEKSKTIEIRGFKANRWLMPVLYIVVIIYFIARVVFKIELVEVLYVVLPLSLVYLYYLTFGRKKYIEIEEI
ncbi:MAG: hypothetical protein A2X13_12000 [Bacteroidetes bacterium GWC2_33_15]|nr:MAG: hypothetical protein A2X10_06025 [Bacteroidetes bacterium GWA2_33_15]OFX50857.1 MAG: hypothetical protein A2X13_12000 [Bacteroidetes bacterium GWC2_33_15]OFX62860.1 MAG: hypothetical protein A2X15_09370 [Bacteroidetes bacterium GWB2_32_14]OFX69930.1 MAG: hypothetical protein A2X14_02230 [Bacteroidetes bacterium GWD2_33_33]HAN18922.1 hypothetical protein [Bacteroidales bacterium]